eukprot:358098-Chlamydomonas_euryale.AAC.1
MKKLLPPAASPCAHFRSPACFLPPPPPAPPVRPLLLARLLPSCYPVCSPLCLLALARLLPFPLPRPPPTSPPPPFMLPSTFRLFHRLLLHGRLAARMHTLAVACCPSSIGATGSWGPSWTSCVEKKIQGIRMQLHAWTTCAFPTIAPSQTPPLLTIYAPASSPARLPASAGRRPRRPRGHAAPAALRARMHGP